MHPLRCLSAKKKAPEKIAGALGFWCGELVFSTIKVLVIRCFNLGDAGF
jgi:hypothetical protein